MSKKIYLICNAHLDPVWQWEWEEGAAEALSTFRIAAKFCEEYDNFVFCHNEALLYEWIEEYDPFLFKKIQELVKLGKWHIMGGWYLQPDCNMPSGEGFVRQILSGKKYFYEKFNVKPTVAVNVDPFGHNRGLVQIMKKTGYNGYLFMRPGNDFIELDDEFKWVGYDDSEINAVKIKYGYASGKGKVDHKINVFIEETKDDDFSLCLWGVGNHGGGPSETDLDNITKMSSELEKDGVELIHSTPEEYFTVIENNRELKKVDVSLNPWAVGCYTSQVRVKQQYRKAENEYYLTENMCTRAYSAGLMKYPYAELKDAMRDILFVQFHDILPGSSIKDSEQATLRTINHSLEILSKLKARAFFALASGQKKASSDKIPFLAYNPYPYPITGEFEVEFNLWDQIHDDVFMKTVVYDEKGNICPSQCEKERSTIPLEWRKKVVFNATLEPMQMNRFDCGFEKIDKKPFNKIVQDDEKYIIDCGNSHFELNKKTGLIDAYSKNSVNYVKDNSFILEVFEDNYDPWYMESRGWTEKIGEFKLLSIQEAKEYIHTDSEIEPVHVIESGDVRTVIEAVFGYKESKATVKYIFSSDGSLGIDINMYWANKQKLVKLSVPTALNGSYCIGEQAYGREKLRNNFDENVSHKYLAVCSDDKALCVYNKGTYGSSFDDGNLKITLLRSPSYCAHPIGGRQTMPSDRFMQYIDIGERDFSFKFEIGSADDILNSAPRKSLEFNMNPMVLSYYPSGAGDKPQNSFSLENTDVIQMTALKKADNKDVIIIRLFNPTEQNQTADLCYNGNVFSMSFGKFEIKTVEYSESGFSEIPLDGEI